MESVIVSGLALTLAVTAVTGNGVNIAAKDAADTQFVNNGIAGVASAMNEYELESADYLDRYISVEKTNAALVAATADGTVISGNDTSEETTEKETVSEEEQEWQNKLMAKVDDFLYVREKADSDSEIVGKMYKGDRAVVKEAGDTWTKIESGNVTGYVKNEYITISYNMPTAKAVSAPAQDTTDTTTTEAPTTEAPTTEAPTTEAPVTEAPTSDLGQQIANFACQFVGNPYVWGGTSLTGGADCSGFIGSVYRSFGYNLPRSSSSQRSAGRKVSYSNKQPGDLICYSGHIAIYIGNGKIVHASSRKTGIKISPKANYRKVLSVRRIVK